MSVRGLAAVYASLLGLTALTVLAAFQDLGGFNLPAALGVAALKAALVVLYFMHLRGESPVARVWAAAGLFWLLILLVFAMADVATRNFDVLRAGQSGVR